MASGNSSSFFGNRPPKNIINGFSAGGAHATVIRNNPSDNACGKEILSGALTATVYKELLAVTGQGSIKFIGIRCVDATARTLGLKVVIDGTTAFDAVSDSISATDTGMIAVGAKNGSYDVTNDNAPFNSSLSVQVKSSLNETDKVAIDVSYYTE